MRQKYLITIDATGAELLISEHAEAETDLYSLLCQETFGLPEITDAAEIGIDPLVDALRTRNFYPPEDYGRRIARAVMELIKNPERGQMEVFIDDNLDRALSAADRDSSLTLADESTDAEDELDTLLDDDVSDDNAAVSEASPSSK